MELRRVIDLPPYVLGSIRELTLELRRGGADVVDLGFGNPDLASPAAAVAKLQDASSLPHNHRYSSSRGIPRLRLEGAELYRRRFGVELDPEREVVTTMGAKEGFVHLMWVLLQPGDAALVPSPSYPIHIHGPAARRRGRLPRADDSLRRPRREPRRVVEAGAAAASGDRPLVPAQPDDGDGRARRDGARGRVRAGARRRRRARLRVRRPRVRRLPAAVDPPGRPAREDVAVELYTLSKSFSMAGWRVASSSATPRSSPV